MVKSLRSVKNLSNKSVQDNSWTKGEEFSFKSSPSPKRNNAKREATTSSKKNSQSKISDTRRKSVYVKRLETDMNLGLPSSPISRRTRRKSMANLSKVEPPKKPMSRIRSEKIISKSKPSKAKLTSPKITRIKSKEQTSMQSQEVDTKLSSDMSSMQITKETFYKSPIRSSKTMIKRESMSEMTLTLSPLKGNLKKSPSSKIEPTIPPKSRSYSKSKIPSKTKPSPKPKPALKAKSPKPKASLLQKPLKRLAVSTPSPRQVRNTRLTRSAAKKSTKKAQIEESSPLTSRTERVTKIPKATTPSLSKSVKIIAPKQSTVERKKSFLKTLKPFTPKPEDPSKLLKQTMKKTVARELKVTLKKNSSLLLSPDIASFRTPSKSLSTKATPVQSLSIKRTPVQSVTKSAVAEDSKNTPSSTYNWPSTPLSSRKASVSFRQYRNSLQTSAESNGRYSRRSPSLLCSTPLKGSTSSDRLHNLSSVSSEEESDYTASFTKSFSNLSSQAPMEAEPEKIEVSQQQQSKRSYCSLM